MRRESQKQSVGNSGGFKYFDIKLDFQGKFTRTQG